MAQLDSTSQDWVEARVKGGLEQSEAVNSVLFGQAGVPDFPNQDAVIVAALNALTSEQVEYMMQADDGLKSSPFSFQHKLLSPDLSTVRTLLDSQPKVMGTPSKEQLGTSIASGVEQHFARKHSTNPTRWFGEFGQGTQIIQPQKDENLSLALGGRIGEFKRSLPKGMRGTDIFTWATRMAAGLSDGKPLDCQFAGDARNVLDSEVQNATILDEEGEVTFSIGGRIVVTTGDLGVIDGPCSLPEQYVVAGTFAAKNRGANVGMAKTSVPVDVLRLRSSIDWAI